MVITNGFRGFFTASILALSLSTAAFAVDCPSATDIKATADSLNGMIRPSEKVYLVFSATPVIDASDLKWMIFTQNTSSDFDTAFNSGTTAVGGVIASANSTAVERGNAYLCAYFTSSGSMNVAAVAPKDTSSALETVLSHASFLNKK